MVLLFALLVAASFGSAGELVERILAVVDEKPLLLSDVRAMEVVRELDRGPALQASIDEHLMYQ
jgi:hypothetical protein